MKTQECPHCTEVEKVKTIRKVKECVVGIVCSFCGHVFEKKDEDRKDIPLD